jgi:hypothetical protein
MGEEMSFHMRFIERDLSGGQPQIYRRLCRIMRLMRVNIQLTPSETVSLCKMDDEFHCAVNERIVYHLRSDTYLHKNIPSLSTRANCLGPSCLLFILHSFSCSRDSTSGGGSSINIPVTSSIHSRAFSSPSIS